MVRQQARIGIRNNQADNQDAEHIEQQDSPEIPDVPRGNVFRRIFRTRRSNTDQLGSLEREKPTIITTPIIAVKPPANGASPIVQLLQPAGCAPEDTDNHISTPTMIKTHNYRDFDQ